MDTNDIATVSVAVTGLMQIVKGFGLPKAWYRLSVLVISAIALVCWGLSKGSLTSANAYNYFSAWIVVSTSSMGIYAVSKKIEGAVTTKKVNNVSSTSTGSSK